jgi:hypothetical protein
VPSSELGNKRGLFLHQLDSMMNRDREEGTDIASRD